MTIRSLPSPSILLSPLKPPVRARATHSEIASNPYKSSNPLLCVPAATIIGIQASPAEGPSHLFFPCSAAIVINVVVAGHPYPR
ncbi:hypothetical protein EJB05_16806, partial [Eragrostis curvula]